MRKNSQPRSRVGAATMAFFGGIIGIHKFYLGEPGGGIFYIILFFVSLNIFSFPVSFILGILDGMKLLSMSDEKFDKKYNRGVTAQDYRDRSRRGFRKRSSRIEQRKARQMHRSGKSLPEQRQVSQRSSSRANPFKSSGIKKHKEFDLKGAIEDFSKGLEISPNDIALHFNIACSYSLTEQKDKAFHHLQRAMELGFNDYEKIKTHDDLAFLRIQPEFEALQSAGFKVASGNASSDNDTKEQTEEIVQDDVLLSQLNKLAELRKKGLLSEKEFMLERRKLLRR